jgi:hypothetical protein
MPARHDILVGALDLPWRTTPDPISAGTPALPAERPPYHHSYDDSRTYFRSEEDFPGPNTMSAAATTAPS